MPDSANKITAEILIKVSRELPNVRLWRQNAGMGLPLAYVHQASAALLKGNIPAAMAALKQRPFRAGVTGTADLSGIAGPNGRRVECEIKAGGDRQQHEQVSFQAMIEGLGGIYIIARSADQCVADLKKRLAELG